MDESLNLDIRGYCIVRNVFSFAECDGLIAEWSRLIERQTVFLKSPSSDPESSHSLPEGCAYPFSEKFSSTPPQVAPRAEFLLV